MGFLRGPGSLQFKWAATKALFPELTSIYYKNTKWPLRTGTRKKRVVPVYPDWYTAPPTADERLWIGRFLTFCKRGDALKNNRSPAAHRRLYFLLWSGSGIQKQYAEFFERERHTKGFTDAYLRFLHKVMEFHEVVEKYIDYDERARIIDQTRSGQISINLDTWKAVSDAKGTIQIEETVEAKERKETRIIDCPKCGQRLRVSNIHKFLRVCCYTCSHRFVSHR